MCLSFGHENENREEKESDLVKMAYINNAGDNLNHTLDKPKLHLHTITCTHVIPLMMNSPISAPLKRSNTTRRTRVGWNPLQISVVEKHLLCDMCPNFCTVRAYLLSYGNHCIPFRLNGGQLRLNALSKLTLTGNSVVAGGWDEFVPVAAAAEAAGKDSGLGLVGSAEVG